MQDKELMQALRDDGMTVADIAEKFEVSVGHVAAYTVAIPNRMSVAKLRSLIESGEVLDREYEITCGRQVVGTFKPVGV